MTTATAYPAPTTPPGPPPAQSAMTTAQPASASQPAGPMRRRRSRRWLRLATPFGVLLALWLMTGVAHFVEEPDLDDPATLSPLGTGHDGSSVLAGQLEDRGVRIDRVTSSRQALAVATGTDSTVFVPTPDFLTPGFLSLIDNIAGSHRVVVVQPGLATLLYSPAPIYPIRDRWATATVAPNCGADYARTAGPAAALNQAYAVVESPSMSCYFGAVTGVRTGDTEIIYVGASDPFRNGRIREGGNAALATGLLGEYGSVIWVDVHEREQVSMPPVELPGLPQYRRGEQDRGSAGDSEFDAFPPPLWAGIALALAGGLFLALAQARRLGTPVAEPLPVLVPAAEAVTGRGRLYDRIRARGPALDALRGAAIARMARVLNPFGGPAPERDLLSRGEEGPPPGAAAFIAQVCARTGAPQDAVRQTLYGPVTNDDASFTRAVADLDALVNAVLRDNPSQHLGGTP